jgi:simple sugar transport system substrate-binding protein
MKTLTGLRYLLAGAAAVAALATATGAVEAADKVKAGFVYVGPVNDNGWTYRHDVGRQEMEKALGDKAEKSSYVENVPEGADAERVITQLATSGHNLIFTTSFGFMNPTQRVAQRFPNVMFEHATGFKREKNMSTYNARFYEGRAVAGLLAGHMTKTKVIGVIGSVPIPELVRHINAFAIGARQEVPDVEVQVRYPAAQRRDRLECVLDLLMRHQTREHHHARRR